jgi:hypothetical protein
MRARQSFIGLLRLIKGFLLAPGRQRDEKEFIAAIIRRLRIPT